MNKKMLNFAHLNDDDILLSEEYNLIYNKKK